MVFEVDQLKTYIKRKSKECWVISALDKQNGEVADLKVGRIFQHHSPSRFKQINYL
jgi:hypothetical protein